VTYPLIQIAVTGPTCRQCDPGAFDQAGEPSARPPEDAVKAEHLFKVWLASRDRAAPRIEVRDITSGGRTARRLDYHQAPRLNVIQPEPPGRQAAADLREAWVRQVEAKLGAPAWQVVWPAWQDEHCDILAALAEALDLIWVAMAGGAGLAYRVAVRLQGLPEILSVLVAEVAARSAATDYRPPLPALADRLRQVGVAVCAAAGSRECVALGAAMERLAAAGPLAAASHEVTVQQLIDELSLPATWAGRTMPALDEAFPLLVAPARPAVGETERSAPRAAPESRLAATREFIRETRKLDTVTRPLVFGDDEA
jgi:hypothetical protein